MSSPATAPHGSAPPVAPPSAWPVLREQGFAALRRQDGVQARQAFEALLAACPDEAEAWVGLAYAQALQRDAQAALQALEPALRLQPHNLRGLLLQADLCLALGRVPEAASGYRLLQRVAEREAARGALPAGLQGELQRAAAQLAQIETQLANDLHQALQAPLQQARAAHGEAATARFAVALEVLTGRQPHYPSQPRLFGMPELAARAFWPREDFAWIPALEAATPALRAEVQALLREAPELFRPYVERLPGRAVLHEGGLLDHSDWTAAYVLRNGAVHEPVARRCPATLAALENLPLPRLPGRAPNVLFSLLQPGAHIPPHHGFVNTRLIAHLPLVVPGACSLRVGAGVHTWEEGRVVVFDDTIEHEAWNRSTELRVVLLFEVWRPELLQAERELVAALFDAVGGHEATRGMERL